MSERIIWVFCFTQACFLLAHSQRDSIISQALTICQLECHQLDTCRISRDVQECVSDSLSETNLCFKYPCRMKCDTAGRPRRRYTCVILVSTVHQLLLSRPRVDQPTRPVEQSEERDNRHIKLSNTSVEDLPADKGNHHNTLSLIEKFENMTPIKSRDSDYRDAVCGTPFTNPDVKFNPSSVHDGCSLTRGVLSNTRGVPPARRDLPHNKKHPQLKKAFGATADFEISNHELKMFFIEFNTSISQDIGVVLEIALCNSHYVDKKSNPFNNLNCNGFFFKNKGKQVTVIPKCWHKPGDGDESYDVRIDGSITLGFFVDSRRKRFVLVDPHRKQIISKCNRFRVKDDVRLVVKLSKHLQSTVRFKRYNYFDAC